jgi:hypothetical protein
MVAEIIAGIALCNSAYKAIKEGINNCKEVGQLAGSIDQLVEGKEQVDRAAKPTNMVASRWGAMMGKKGIDNEGSLSVGSIVQEKINQKLADEELKKVRFMVNRRFGLGTWEDIMMERQERLEKAKTRQQKEREKRKEQVDKWFEYAKNGIITILVVLGMFITFMFYTGRWTL